MTHQNGDARLLTRGTTVLSAVGRAKSPQSFGQIQRETHLPKATLSRILATLRGQGFLALDVTGKAYGLGPEMLDMLAGVEPNTATRVALKTEVQRLADELEQPVWHWRRQGDGLRVLEQILPFGMASETDDHPVKRLDKTAPGVAVLSAMDAAELTQVLDRFSATDDPPHRNVSLALGFSVATGFATREAAGNAQELAAAITDATGKPVAALSVVCDWANTSETERHQIGRKIAFAAQQISSGPTAGPRKRDVGTRSQPAVEPAPNRRVERIEGTPLDKVGSSPFWDARHGRVVWIDSLGGAVNCLDQTVRRVDHMGLPGAITSYPGGKSIIAAREGISIFDYGTNSRTALSHPEPTDALRRFSTAKIGPDGRFWVGTLRPVPTDGPGQGRIYAMGRSGRIDQMLELERGPKGMCWSPDGGYFYVTVAGSKTILRYELDARGRPVNPRRFARHTGEGTPNGITMDREGCLWAAIYGGWQVARFNPNGQLIETIDLPVPLPTGLCFWGAKRRDLFVTTCRLHVPPEILLEAPDSGAAFRIETDTVGEIPQEFR